MENTDAESVEDIVAASSNAKTNGISIPSHGATAHTNNAIIKAVSTTPTVASTTPGPITGRIWAYLVSIPPVKRMTHNAIMPMNCVMSTDRNEIRSHPKIMPTPRNNNNAGAPNR